MDNSTTLHGFDDSEAREVVSAHPGVEETEQCVAVRKQVVIQQGINACRGLCICSQQLAQRWRLQREAEGVEVTGLRRGGLGKLGGVEQFVPSMNSGLPVLEELEAKRLQGDVENAAAPSACTN